MNGFMNFMETKFVPVAAKIGAQRHLVAVRDSFAAIMPLIIAGSMGVLINNMQFTKDAATDPYQTLMPKIFGEGWKSFGGNIWWGTFAIMSVFIAFMVAYNLAKSYDANPIQAGVLSLATYFLFIPSAPVVDGAGKFTELFGQLAPGVALPETFDATFNAWGNINWSFLRADALFVAIIIGIAVAEAFRLLSKSKLLIIKMPEQVPPAVARSFAALFPSMIILAVASWILMFFFTGPTNLFGMETASLFEVITKFVTAPIAKAGNTFGAALLLPLFAQTLWFFGIHGSNIIDPIMQAVFVPNVVANAEAISAGLKPTFIVTKSFFDAFVNMGGSGTTLALIAAIFVGSKRKDYRLVAGMSTPPGIFNINESMIFGIPIILNPMMIIPFMLTPLVLTTIAYVATAIGLVPMTSVVIPWVMPPVLGGFMATAGSPMGALLALVNLVVAFLIYLPFVMIANKTDAEKVELKKSA